MKTLWRNLLQKTLRDSARKQLEKQEVTDFGLSCIFEGEDLSMHCQDVKLDNEALQDVVKSFIIARRFLGLAPLKMRRSVIKI